jgi:2-polyprenyl-3-methyl-5-hydroxy-6-metoxy-1,4-benzoquinol methylase
MRTDDEYLASQWDANAAEWARQVRARMDLYREHVNNPCMIEMLGGISGLQALDAGCGEGASSRLLAGLGAKVVGVDFSREMIRLAIEEEEREPLGIEYHWGSLCDLSFLEEGSFDIAISFMTIMDVADFETAFGEVARALKPAGRFLFSILHPCFATTPVAGWVFRRPGDLSSANRLYYKVDRYWAESAREMNWRLVGADSELPSRNVDFHRTLSSYVNALSDAGLVLVGMREPQPQEILVQLDPNFEKNRRIPYFLHIEAQKTSP